ncbi:MAG: hypothetical protein HY924_06580 [Elusimicrobia bacterium]|nr:hypothetical protein [Elusimicrobiota bacterium]
MNPPFVASAERFAAEHGRSLAFRLLGLLTRCQGPDLELVVKKTYCASIPENTYATPENPWKTRLGILLLPLAWLSGKSVLWRPLPPVDVCLEVPDSDYFEAHLEELFCLLSGSKRVAPMTGGPGPGVEWTAPAQSSVRLRDCLLLLLAAPVLLPALWALQRASGVPLLQAFRQALSIYAVYRGFFGRYPCRRFITIHDDSNHPCRHLAFRQSGGEELVVIQNGERIAHPHFSFGSMDRYFVFGKAHEQLLRSLGVRASAFVHCGALFLDARFRGLDSERVKFEPRLYDVLFVDQGVYPFEGFNERSGRSIEKVLANLAAFKGRHPERRVAYQLRAYTGTATHRLQKEAVLSVLGKLFGKSISILDNDGKGASYRNVLRSELVMTFESSLGFEALRLGVKALFVNYSGDPAETVCEDERFQLMDDAADFGRFEAKVLGLLAFKLDAAPQAALERNAAMDGRFAQRVSAAINAG